MPIDQEALHQYQERYPDEIATVETFKTFLQHHNEQEKAHLTASAWLIKPSNHHVLLTHHKKLQKWLQLGGHMSQHEHDTKTTALREAKEESGIENIICVDQTILHLGVYYIPEIHQEPAHYHFDVCYLHYAHEPCTTVKSSESNALKWFSCSELCTTSQEPSIAIMARKWQLLSHNILETTDMMS
jgi:8-oxo-dGTP pyrophosphatase MutT (NUDIX family)